MRAASVTRRGPGVLGGGRMERRAPWRSVARGATATLAWLDLLGADPLGAGEVHQREPVGAGEPPASAGQPQAPAPAGETTASAGQAPASADEPAYRPFEAALTRVNFRGRTVSLAGGVAAGAGVLGAALRPYREAQRADLPLRARRSANLVTGAALLAGASAAGAGLVDDLDQGAHDGQAPAKGLHGHLAALAAGQVTTGVLKIGVIGAGALGAGAMLTAAARPGGEPGRTGAGARGRAAADVLVRAVAIASWANVHNLLDLRPGRALKVAGLMSGARVLVPGRGVPGTPRHVVSSSARVLAGGALGVVAASLPTDLGERTMLGDTGANAVGALVGTTLAASGSARLRALAAVSGTALVLASEKVSYSAIIARTPFLAALDGLGRREEP